MFGSRSRIAAAERAAAEAEQAAEVAAEKALGAQLAEDAAREELREHRREQREAALASAKERLSEARETLSEKAADKKGTWAEKAAEARDRAKEAGEHAAKDAREAGSRFAATGADGAGTTKGNLMELLSAALVGGAAMGHRGKHASGAAREAAKAWAEPHVEHLRPTLENARHKGVEAAAPKVSSAAEALVPKVDSAHHKLVDDLLPRLVDAINAAAEAAVAKADTAASASKAGLTSVAHLADAQVEEVQATKKRGVGRNLLLLGAIGAGALAAYSAWKASQPVEDPWAVATAAEPTPPPAQTFPTESADTPEVSVDTADEFADDTNRLGDQPPNPN